MLCLGYFFWCAYYRKLGFTPGLKITVPAIGAEVNAKGKYRWLTPLHQAAFGGHKEGVGVLIAKDAEVNVKEVNSDTPLNFAVGQNESETADLLRKYGGKAGEELKTEGK